MTPADEDKPWLVLVTGEPGSGKTTLAVELSRHLRLPYFSRDSVRGGILATGGLWTNPSAQLADRESAREAFVSIVETAAVLGVSAVVEFVALRDQPEQTERLLIAGKVLLVRTVCEDAVQRVDRRDRHDPFLNRDGVLSTLGYDSIDHYLASPQRELIRDGAVWTLGTPELIVTTNDGHEPALPEIVDWIVERTRP